MSEPEIARRCSACGASVRQNAIFCPQCGNQVPQPATTTEGVRGRVEKIRKVSSVMIDQAAYDPSLRFLLIAAGMFLLFLILLILSKVIG
jgi:predicted amidophosphoribosyltransferase